MDDRREDDRHEMYTLLPVNIIVEATRASIACRVENVSPDGLGIVTDAALEPGTKLALVTLKTTFGLEVAWCKKTDGRREYRCGLRLTETDKHLGSVFVGFFASQSRAAI